MNDPRCVVGAEVFVYKPPMSSRAQNVVAVEGVIASIGRKYIYVEYKNGSRRVAFEYVDGRWIQADETNYKATLYFSQAEFDEHCVERPNLNKILLRAGDWQSRVSLEKMPLEELRTVTNILSKYLK